MRPHYRLVLLAVLTVPAAVRAWPGESETSRRPLLLPSGVADLAGRTGFLANANRGIDAIDLVTGELVWQTSAAQRPLIASGDRIYAYTLGKDNHFRIMAFDVGHKGAVVFESAPLTLPSWVVTTEGPGRSLILRCRLEKDHLMLAWDAKTSPPGVKGGDRLHAAGSFDVDLTTGKAKELPAEPAAARPPVELDKLVVRWQGWVGNNFKALVLEEEETQQKLLLRTWDKAGNAVGPPRELLRGQRLLVQPTVDELFLCIRDASASPDNRVEADRLRSGWTIFAVDSGEAVEHAPFVPGTQATSVQGSRHFVLVAGQVRGAIDRPFMHPRSLQAIDLKTGKLLWERPVEGKQMLPPEP